MLSKVLGSKLDNGFICVQHLGVTCIGWSGMMNMLWELDMLDRCANVRIITLKHRIGRVPLRPKDGSHSRDAVQKLFAPPKLRKVIFVADNPLGEPAQSVLHGIKSFAAEIGPSVEIATSRPNQR